LTLGEVALGSLISKVLAVLLGPAVILVLMAGTRPYGMRMTPALTLMAYILAHFLFWPPLLATNYLGRRLHWTTMPRLTLLMAGASATMSVAISGPFAYFHFSPGYGWHEVVRDASDLAIVAAGGFILYRLLLELNIARWFNA
jgi:hypothetical protein